VGSYPDLRSSARGSLSCSRGVTLRTKVAECDYYLGGHFSARLFGCLECLACLRSGRGLFASSFEVIEGRTTGCSSEIDNWRSTKGND